MFSLPSENQNKLAGFSPKHGGKMFESR